MTLSHSKHKNVNLQIKTNIGYFHLIALAYMMIFIISNMAAVKVGVFFGKFLDTGTLYFPILYILNDMLTEIYGFKASRKVIWLTIGCNLLFVASLYIAAIIPGTEIIDSNQYFNIVFTTSPRILLASVTSFLIGEYVNSLVLAISKIRWQGKWFGARAIFSTLVGVAIESTLFAFIAFYDRIGSVELMEMTIALVIVKVLYELFSLPITIRIVSFLKNKEGVDHYDYNTKFNILPF